MFGFLIAMAGIGGGVALVLKGKELTGFGTFFTSLAALVGAFVYTKKTGSKEQQTKQKPEESGEP